MNRLTPSDDASAEPLGLPRQDPETDRAARMPVEMLASDYLDALREGQQLSIEEYVARHPEHAEELNALLPLVEAMEEWKTDKHQVAKPPPLPQTFDIQRLGDCRIVREIGRGGMGVVFEGLQESLGRRVAVKLLPGRFGRDELWRQRFQREARLAASLRHSNIVPVFRFGEYEEFCYYVMPFIVGMGLDWVISRLREVPGAVEARQIEQARMGTGVPDSEGPQEEQTDEVVELPESDTSDTDPSERRLRARSWKKFAKIGAQAAAALRYAHGRGLLHRDIKPANLLLDTSGTVWVTDFGLAQRIEHAAENPSIAGTLRYMPPEQLDGISDERSDIYSLGLTLYELAALEPAFDGTNRAELRQRIRTGNVTAIGDAAPEIPRRLAAIISRAMAADPDDRFQSADELATALLEFLDRGPGPSPASGWLSRMVRRGRR